MHGPIRNHSLVVNRFAALASPVGQPEPSDSPDRPKSQMLVTGDSFTLRFRLVTPVTVTCIPGSRALNIEANLRVEQAQSKDKRYDDTDVHVSINNVRMKQSEVTNFILDMLPHKTYVLYHTCK